MYTDNLRLKSQRSQWYKNNTTSTISEKVVNPYAPSAKNGYYSGAEKLDYETSAKSREYSGFHGIKEKEREIKNQNTIVLGNEENVYETSSSSSKYYRQAAKVTDKIEYIKHVPNNTNSISFGNDYNNDYYKSTNNYDYKYTPASYQYHDPSKIRPSSVKYASQPLDVSSSSITSNNYQPLPNSKAPSTTKHGAKVYEIPYMEEKKKEKDLPLKLGEEKVNYSTASRDAYASREFIAPDRPNGTTLGLGKSIILGTDENDWRRRNNDEFVRGPYTESCKPASSSVDLGTNDRDWTTTTKISFKQPIGANVTREFKKGEKSTGLTFGDYHEPFTSSLTESFKDNAGLWNIKYTEQDRDKKSERIVFGSEENTYQSNASSSYPRHNVPREKMIRPPSPTKVFQEKGLYRSTAVDSYPQHTYKYIPAVKPDNRASVSFGTDSLDYESSNTMYNRIWDNPIRTEKIKPKTSTNLVLG